MGMCVIVQVRFSVISRKRGEIGYSDLSTGIISEPADFIGEPTSEIKKKRNLNPDSLKWISPIIIIKRSNLVFS